MSAPSSETSTTLTRHDDGLPATMKAVTRRRYGGPDVATVEAVPRPDPGSGEVLLRVAAAGLDRATHHLLTGRPLLARLAFGVRRPRLPVLGQQVAGEVVAVGDGVSGYAVGDRAFGTASGSFADFAVAAVTTVAPTPASVSDVEAATVGVSGLTAFDAVVTRGRVRAGERVLVLGGSGAVGSFAVQLAAGHGAEVTAACSGAKRDFVTALGAHHTVDYRTTGLPEMGGPFDLIIDIAGNRSLSSLRSALTPAGRLVIVGGEGGGPLLGGIERNLWASVVNRFSRRDLGWLFSGVTSDRCAQFATLIAAREVIPAIDRIVGLDQGRSALAAMARGELRGQVVICPGWE
ncbi:MAG TPA: NAD(P)-dependent alcohol dehydrogenase [Phycicoccus sp.]|nr:NAD(P)-dependent alcohol dehydrogenase [Phycicoccus sp.]